ncbi:hypothetical protein P9112_009935 [Eukaryota sp. TZLM1-RC]
MSRLQIEMRIVLRKSVLHQTSLLPLQDRDEEAREGKQGSNVNKAMVTYISKLSSILDMLILGGCASMGSSFVLITATTPGTATADVTQSSSSWRVYLPVKKTSRDKYCD